MTLKERLLKTKMPIGISEFTEIVDEKRYYSDKTLFIRDLIESESKIILFTRPRRFGKTLNMTMLKTFFENPLDGKDTSHYFKHLKIWQAGEKYTAEQGKRPVIFLSLKEMSYSNFKDASDALKGKIRSEFWRHEDLRESKAINDDERSVFDRIAYRKGTQDDWTCSIRTLCAMLHKHYGERPVLLIDEYDQPIQKAWAARNSYYEEMIDFMNNLLSAALKDNPHLYRGVLTGITRISKESIFSGLNNLTVDTILDNKFSEYFGLTEEDVQEMLAFYGVPDRISEVREWYDGYIFGNRDMYNPWSLIQYMANECDPKDYWVNTSANELAGELIKKMENKDIGNLYKLMHGGKINAPIEMNMVYANLEDDPTLAYGLLAQAGYLKAGNLNYEEGVYSADLQIPNKELQSVYSREIIKRITDKPARDYAFRLANAITSRDSDTMQRELNDFMLSTCSYLDMTEEKDYQNLLIGLLGTMRAVYEIKANRESGYGRSDILMRPKLNVRNAGNMPGIIIELKHHKATEEERKSPEMLESALNSEAEEALLQIDRKQYEAEVRSTGCKTVIRYGAAFYGKKAVIIQPPGQKKHIKEAWEDW